MTRASRISDVLPLSPLQSGLFFHATAGDADVYRYQLELEIDGPLDPGLLRRCADLLLDRHPALRTAFLAEETDEPVGVVLDGLGMPWQQVDLSGRPDAERSSALRALVVGERTRPFPLDRAPLLRLLLVRLGEARFRLVFTNHHIVLDGWSVPVLLRELFTLYGAGGDPAALPPTRPFRDYLAWLAGRDQAEARARWRTALAELAGPTLLAPGGILADLPVRRPVPVDQVLSAGLVGLAREHGVTVNTVLQVLWALVLGTLTGRRDVVFGATVTGRPAELAGADSMVGLFINTVPVRIRLAPRETAAELLERVQREQARLLDAQYLGLAELQRDAGYAPLFDTLMVFESYPSGGLDELLARVGLAVRPAAARDATHYPLVLVAAPGDPLSVALKYQPGALSAERVDGIAARFVDLARRLVADPGRRLAELPAITGAEASELARWNDTAAPVTDATLVDLVERMVTANPEAPAMRWAGGVLTYRELDRRANRLAHRLREHGVDAEARVGLHLPRSPELVLAMLAVLKAGGAFVPLEPDWPPPRVQAVAADAGVVAVCAAGPVVFSLGDVPVIQVGPAGPGTEAEGTGSGADTAPARRIDGEQLAYVIYTSGSTGTPKGAMIRHRSIANRMTWQRDLLGFGPGDAALFKAPLAFDISINEIFLPLTTGAALVIAPPGAERDVESLVELITKERVSFCYLVASMLAAMLELPGFGSVAPRHVWCGGELLTPELFARFRAEVGAEMDATVYHGYGPAEATVGVTSEVYRPGFGRDGATIGRPNPNTRIQVLDEFLRQTPPGVVGELYVGGLLLGRGYVGDPGRTAERFVADPFGAPGERLYRTGDLAAWLPDGRLRFAGRADNQVKIRGMRVEPEEIESVLATHPAIAQAAVIAPTDATGAPRLVGFYTPRGPEHAPVEELRRWLRARLAEHMVPAELVAVAVLPSQPSGKVDRRALQRSVPTRRASAAEARTPTEATLLKAFRAVLAREDFGVTDDFFAFGGYSLLATRLVVALRAALDSRLAVRALFDHPTVGDLAEYLDGARSDPPRLTDQVLLPLRTRGSRPPLFCVHPVSGLALAYSGLLRGLPDRPVYGLQAHSLASDADLPADLDAMAARYVSEIRAVQPAGPYHLLGWSLGGTVAHLMACQLAAQGERVDSLALLDAVPARFLGEPDSHWSLERGLARLLGVSGYRVGADEVDPARAVRLVTEGDGGLSGFTGDDLCNVALSWRHSSGLRAAAAPVYPGELVLFEAARERREVGLALLWQTQVTGPVRLHPVPAGHWEMAQPDALDQVAAVLRAPAGG
ncbi:MAG TPA: amino acid adenylation domain-containing protein [Pseudonocardia sp.]|uniref:amino acid adenylation domain-containing protein n=1 Tax=Pseudonocardia sp. TaxID=60912 RepID=UPI002EDAFC7D